VLVSDYFVVRSTHNITLPLKICPNEKDRPGDIVREICDCGHMDSVCIVPLTISGLDLNCPMCMVRKTRQLRIFCVCVLLEISTVEHGMPYSRVYPCTFIDISTGFVVENIGQYSSISVGTPF